MADVKPATARVAVITGAAQGLGKELARQLYADGFKVALGDIQASAAEAAAQEIGGVSDCAIGGALDVTSAASVDQFVTTVVETLGSVDVLVNNAGVVSIHKLQDVTEAEWDRVHGVNLKGVFLCCRAAVPLLMGAGWGRVVNIASDAGKRGDALVAHYAASKFGVIGLTQSLAMELVRTGVTVNAICPATIDTPMMRQVRDGFAAEWGNDPSEAQRQMVELMPMGRVTQPADVANALSWLVSDASEFITGQAINVTGGRWMH
jgi:NAD(P)-dependent dehydrogenase (short-subunit alcohol dehydrogenase family)